MAPAKAFVSYAISKKVPLVVRADVRQILGGADGMVADLDAYLPPPGGSRRLIMLAGPSYTYADHRYMQKEFPGPRAGVVRFAARTRGPCRDG